jgi:hypothetical protein
MVSRPPPAAIIAGVPVTNSGCKGEWRYTGDEKSVLGNFFGGFLVFVGWILYYLMGRERYAGIKQIF